MIAYNKSWLYNLFVREEARQAYAEGSISKEENEQININFPALFYTPNLFIRIGLLILTNIIILFSFGLISLVFFSIIEKAYAALAIIFSIITYAALEFIIKQKKHYASGVDDALVMGFGITLFCGISFPNDLGAVANCILIFIISLFCTVRFADRLMAAICFVSLLAGSFFICAETGGLAKVIAPFLIMAVSLLTYIFTKRVAGRQIISPYSECVQVISVAALLGLYIAGNYWMVRELSNSMFNLQLQRGQSIPFGFVFWMFTVLIPFVYLGLGVFKRDILLIRIGLLLVAAIVFTVRYYHALLPPETAMVFGGSILVFSAWALSRYLKISRYGFTADELRLGSPGRQLEAIILAETFARQPGTADGTKFGGGNFGGGGSSGDF